MLLGDQQVVTAGGQYDILTRLFFQVLLKSDRVDALLSRVLPHGQLLFLNHRFAQGLEKEVAAYASK